MKISVRNKHVKILGLLIAGTFVATAYNNCSKVAVSDIPGSASAIASDPKVGESGTVFDPGRLITGCDEAKKAGRISVQKIEVTFEDPARACDWSTNENAANAAGNLSQVDGLVRARIEQEKVVQVATNAKICNIMMTNANEQNFRYDDNIILTLNQFVLASTTDFSQHFTATNGYRKYDWSRLVNQNAQNAKSDSTPDKQYCAGKSAGLSSCQFPETETVGKVDLQFNQRVIQNILGMTNPTEAKLGFITTGDNDPGTDCQHVPIRLLLDIEYFL